MLQASNVKIIVKNGHFFKFCFIIILLGDRRFKVRIYEINTFLMSSFIHYLAEKILGLIVYN